MENAYEIISRIDRALGESVGADYKDYAAQGAVVETLQEVLRDTKALVEDSAVVLSIHVAVALVNNLNAACKHFLLMKCPELAFQAKQK